MVVHKIMLVDEQRENEKTLLFAFIFITLGVLIFLVYSTGYFNIESSVLLGIIFFILLVILIKNRKKIGKRSKIPWRGFVKDYLVWFIAFTIGIYLADLIIRKFNIGSSIFGGVIILFVYGLVIEICSKIMQILVFKWKWKLNKYFFFWVITQSVCFFIAFFLVNFIPQETILSVIKTLDYMLYARIILMGIVQMVLIRIVWRFNIERIMKE